MPGSRRRAEAMNEPDPPPFDRFELPVSHGHRLQVEQWGTPHGRPLLLLHGGPGSGFTPALRRFFDPARFRVIAFDQRGSGRSQPAGGTDHNDTALLIDDIARLRSVLGTDRWLIVGGSWGATLALAYAATEPEVVEGLLIRSVFLARPEDIAPVLPHAEAFAGSNETDRPAAALAWWRVEAALSGGAGAEPAGAALTALLQRYTVQAHYLRAGCWLQSPPLLDRLAPLRAVPTRIVHGTADRLCPPDGARLLAERLPQATLHWAEGVGHEPFHPAMRAAMAEALGTVPFAG